MRKTIAFLTKGCKCKKGCINNRCTCYKSSNQCGPSCRCINCKNLSSNAAGKEDIEFEVDDDNDDYDDVMNAPDEVSDEDLDAELLDVQLLDMLEEIFDIPF